MLTDEERDSKAERQEKSTRCLNILLQLKCIKTVWLNKIRLEGVWGQVAENLVLGYVWKSFCKQRGTLKSFLNKGVLSDCDLKNITEKLEVGRRRWEDHFGVTQMIWFVRGSVVSDFVTPWTVAYQAPQSMKFPRQEYWCGLPFPSPGDLPNPGIEPGSSALQANSLLSEPPGMGEELSLG